MDEEPEVPWWKYDSERSKTENRLYFLFEKRLVFLVSIVFLVLFSVYWTAWIFDRLSVAVLERVHGSPVYGPWLLYTHEHLICYTTFLIVAAILAVFGLWNFRATEEWSGVKKVSLWFLFFLILLLTEATFIGITHRHYTSQRHSIAKDDPVTLKQVFP